MIERARQSNHKEFVRTLKTSYKFENKNPWWDAVQMTMTEFCNNSKYLPIKMSVYSYQNSGDHPHYGSVITTTREIEMGIVELVLLNKKGKPAGTLKFN